MANDTLINDNGYLLLSNTYQGPLAISIAVVGFGSAHVPIRKFPVYDGIFVQFAMSVGILFTGFIISMMQSFPPIEPYAIAGGCLWAIANTMSQRVISELGLAVGLLLWMSTNCIIGWSIGKFGLFGIKPKPIENDVLNFIGLLALLFGSFFIAFIRKVPPQQKQSMEVYNIHTIDMEKSHPFSEKIPIDLNKLEIQAKKQMSFLHRNSERIICIILALIAGFFYCVTLVPIFYMEENADLFPNAPRTGVPYVFSHFFGVFICSSLIFVIYSIIRKNKPLINPEIVLPSFCGGSIWALAMTGLIISNDLNGQTITYPLTTTLPGLVASAWSVFLFKEINSKRNYTLLLIAFLFIGAGALLVLMSKIKF